MASGAFGPVWRADGRELFYLTPQALMAVPVATQPTLTLGSPQSLFPLPPNVERIGDWGVSPDGARFYFLTGQPVATAPFTFLLNWQAALSRRQP